MSDELARVKRIGAGLNTDDMATLLIRWQYILAKVPDDNPVKVMVLESLKDAVAMPPETDRQRQTLLAELAQVTEDNDRFRAQNAELLTALCSVLAELERIWDRNAAYPRSITLARMLAAKSGEATP